MAEFIMVLDGSEIAKSRDDEGSLGSSKCIVFNNAESVFVVDFEKKRVVSFVLGQLKLLDLCLDLCESSIILYNYFS